MNAVSSSAPSLLALDEAEMADLVAGFGWPAYRTGQILRWLYQRRVRTIAEMTDLSQAERARLSAQARIGRLPDCVVFRSADDTRKLILKLEDGLEVEAVLIPDDGRLTLCVSTQVGCTLDCGF